MKTMSRVTRKRMELYIHQVEICKMVYDCKDIDILAVTLLAFGKRLSSKRMLKANLDFVKLKEV